MSHDDTEDDMAAARAELKMASLPMDELIAWAERNPPPQEWFDEDLDSLFESDDAA